MTSRRQETRPPEQPVRLYKFIALTFLVLTIILLGVIVFMSSKRATIVISAESVPVDVTSIVRIGGEAGDIAGELQTVVVKDMKDFPITGTRQEDGVAGGMVTLKNDGDTAQALVATTRLLSADNILFRLKRGITVPARGSISAEVYADQPGQSGNIEPARFTIPGLNEAKQKIIYAVSDIAMTGGTKKIGVLGQADISSAEKSLLSALQEKGAKELSDNRPSVYTVAQNVFEHKAEAGDEVAGSFSLSGQATVLGVFYDQDALKKFAEMELRKRVIDDTERIESGREEPKVTIKEFDLEKKTAVLEVFYNGIAGLNPESRQLEKSLFFGKSRDEVRRYVLKLDHVRGVDVIFRPAWMRAVPYIPDHVSVVIKEGE